jgi:hypothetical protein
VKDYNIAVNGLTASEKVSRNLRNIPHSKIEQSNILRLSYMPYEVSKILSVNIGISIKTFKKTKLDKGCKVNIIGFRNIDINYLASDSDKEVHELKYKIPFSTELSYNYNDIKVKNVYVPVDKLQLKILDPKQLILETRVYVAPVVL